MSAPTIAGIGTESGGRSMIDFLTFIAAIPAGIGGVLLGQRLHEWIGRIR